MEDESNPLSTRDLTARGGKRKTNYSLSLALNFILRSFALIDVCVSFQLLLIFSLSRCEHVYIDDVYMLSKKNNSQLVDD